MRGTGVLPAELVRALGGVGVPARASGRRRGLRRDHPYAALRRAAASGCRSRRGGDVRGALPPADRRGDASLALLAALLAARCRTARSRRGSARCRPAIGFGAVESPRGANVHWVRIDADGQVDRLRIRSASFPNWPIVPLAVPGNMVPDFPLINKSFELCYACLDR